MTFINNFQAFFLYEILDTHISKYYVCSGWHVTPCILQYRSYHFRGNCYLHIRPFSLNMETPGFHEINYEFIKKTIQRKVQKTVRHNHKFFFNPLHLNTLPYILGFLIICDTELKIQRGTFIVSPSVVEILTCHSELFANTAALLLPLINLRLERDHTC